MNPIREALEQSGLNASTLDRIRLARGVLGKTSYVAVAAIAALALLRDTNYLLSVLVTAVFVVYYGGALWFANRHPGVALLEGAELIQWRQMDIAAKSIAPIENVPVLPEPKNRGAETR